MRPVTMDIGTQVRETEKSGRTRPRTGAIEDIAHFRVGDADHGSAILKVRWDDGFATFHRPDDDRIEAVGK